MVTRSFRPRATSFHALCAASAGALVIVATRLPAQSPQPTMPDSVRGYIRDAMTIFRERSVHREVDWQALEDSVVARSAGAETPSGTWRPLTWALRRVDRHSYLAPPPEFMAKLTKGMSPSAAPATQATRPPAATLSGGEHSSGLLDGAVGVVTVPPHTGPNRTGYVDSLRARIRALDSAGACGWVVDLRENSGGNMWPMLAGIGPLLGAEVVGSFTNNPKATDWHYRDGRSWQGSNTPPAEVSGWGTLPPVRVRDPAAPVALLVGRTTASSGEITMLAFLGRPNVRSFGDSTAGYASVNSSIRLRDGAMMVVTAGYPRDRLGRRYALTLAPDELVPASDSAGSDAPLRRAVAWLREQPSCAERR